jgi:hypothetical protein
MPLVSARADAWQSWKMFHLIACWTRRGPSTCTSARYQNSSR